MSTMAWTKDENGNRTFGSYRISPRGGRFDVYNGHIEPVRKRLSLAAAMKWVEEREVTSATEAGYDRLAGGFVGIETASQAEPEVVPGPEPTPVSAPIHEPKEEGGAPVPLTYDDFVLTILEKGWSADQIGGDEPQPQELVDLLASAGEQAESWLAKAIESGDLNDAAGEAQSLATLHGDAGADATTVPTQEATPEPLPAPTPTNLHAMGVQAIMNDLVWRHGKNLPSRGDYPDIIREAGLTADQVTPQIMGQAMTEFSARLERNRTGDRLHWLPPVEEDVNAAQAKAHVWRTECGSYRACRVDGPSPRFAAFARIDAKAAAEREIVNDLQSLRTALEAVEKYHCNQNQLPAVRSNLDRIIQEAEELGLHRRPVQPTISQSPNSDKGATDTEGGTIMHITEENARGLVNALKLPGAADWKLPKLGKALNDLAPRIDGADITDLGDAEKKLLRRVLDANQKGTSIQVGDAAQPEPSQPKGKGKAGKGGKTTKDKTNPERGTRTVRAEKVHRGDPEQLDGFGSRVGSSNALVNAVLGKTPMKFSEIAQAAKLGPKQVRYAHLDFLVEKGYAKKEDKAWSLTAKGLKAQSK